MTGPTTGRETTGGAVTDHPPTVLVVEDERNLAELYAAYLSDEYDVRTAFSGDEALEQLDETVDVVLLDRRMPGRSGDEVLDEISRRGYDCAVAMATAVLPDLDIVDMPIDAYLTKPIDRGELRQTVAQLLTFADHEDAIREFVRLSLKQVTLETERDRTVLRESAEYQRLNERLATLSRSADDLDELLSEAELDLFLRSIVRDMDDTDDE